MILLKVEVYLEDVPKEHSLCDEQKNISPTEKEMKKNQANLQQITNYLIQLFYMTGQQYSCTQTKIGKLLSILAFVYARNNEILFEEAIYRYKDCGAVVGNIKTLVPDLDVYIQSNYLDCNQEIKCPIDDDCPDILESYPDKYKEIEILTPELKKNIEQVFRKFGAYPAHSIGHLINSIVNHDGVTGYNEIINLDEIQNLELEDFEASNELIDFIFSKEIK